MLKVQLFGAGRVTYAGQPLAGFPNQQACLLLCYLLLNRAYPQTRERLAALFWGDLPAATARKSLRNALWRMRQSLQSVGAQPDDYLVIGDESVSFLASSGVWLDVAVFETAVAALQDTPGAELSDEQAARLAEAVDLYTGELLDGVYADWCLHERERLGLLYLAALQKLMAYHGRRGEYERALQYGERILACDNTREKVHRQMMHLLWLAGDRNAALAQYRRCAQILREELDTTPMPETTRLYEQMAANNYNPAEPAAAPAGRAARPEAIQSLARHALDRLRRLQAAVEETHAELRQLEQMLGAALSEP